MYKKYSVIVVIILLFALVVSPVHAQLPQISSGLNYITSSQNPDGTWATGTAEVETTAATVSVLETLKLLNQTAGTSYAAGATWLQAQTPLSVDYIAQRLHALSLADVNLLTPSADLTKGGWGGDSGYETNPLDTASALQALKSANYSDLTTINPALAYLTGNQNSDGGWGFTNGNDSNVYLTAIVSATLQQFPQMTTIATAVNKATSYLLAHQNADGGFGSVYETALTYSALVAVSTDNAALANAVNYLTAAQSANGSWNDDPYSTALALKALYFSENKPSPPPPPPAGGKITGTVIDKVSGQKVAGVAVVLDSNQLINTTTDATGTFTLSDIPAGAQKVNFSLTGYAATSATATVVVDTIANLGTIPMTSSYSTGTIAGTITDSAGKPLADAAITVTGAWSGSATTGADGTYSFTYVIPGTVTISAAKTGFQIVTAPGAVYARTTLTFSPRMSTTAPQATTGTLVGHVVDNYWGLPIDHLPEEKGVEVTLPGGFTVPVDADNGGYFSIPDLDPGTYQVVVGMHGFASHVFSVVITPGGTTDLGTIRLEMSFLMTLTGKITDASTGVPIPGAEVTIPGKNFTGRTDASGTYAIADIPSLAEYTVKFTADGYVGKSYTIGAKPWLQTMDVSLSQRLTTGSITGNVIDAATSLPLAGVTLTLTSDSTLTATTDNSGVFTLNSIQPGPQRFNLTMDGYTPRTLSTVMRVGVVVNAGKLSLGVTELPASIQGTAQKVGADAPFAGVTIQTTGDTPLQTVTAADGTYVLDEVPPGPVTVTAHALSNPGFTNARLTGILEPGGILVFNPALSMMLPGTLDLSVQTDKAVYVTGDTVGIAINLRNMEAETIVAALHVRVSDPNGVPAYETSVNVNIDADGVADQPQSFLLPSTAKSGRYMVLTEAFDATGALLGNSYKYFDVTVSQVAVTPVLPVAFAAGDNALVFNLVNSGTLAVSAGTFSVTLKDPDGQVVSAAMQNFSLALGENTTIATSLSIPPLKFGTYTLSYVQSDETKPGQAIDITLPNTASVSALYDDASHRIRDMASLTVTVRNTGRFDFGSASVTAAVPAAEYSETKALTALAVGNSSALLYQFTIPETMTAGQHGTRITITLPSGSTTTETGQLAIMESSLSQSPIQTTFTAGDTIHPLIANSGGVDTPVQYRLSLYDAKAALIAETTDIATATAGASLSLALAIPTGAVDGSYNLVVTYKDTKTGKEVTAPNGITINGVKGTLQVQTDKENYLLTESIAGISSMTSGGTPLTDGNLHLQVTTGPGVQTTKTWTTQADFQTGVRNGVDTYGVNDWIIPDDDFSGTAIDSNKWNISNDVTLQAGRVFIDSTVNGSGIGSKWKLEGDFDIQVDYDTNNSFNNQGPQLIVSGTNFFAVVHNNLFTGDSGDIRVDGKQYYTDNHIYRNSGKLRITRVANTVATFYWSGSGWSEINHIASANLNTPCSVQLRVYRNTGYATGASAFYDNFKLNSGRIKSENQTVDSVRLLPLNDNFDDGVLNEDRWGVDSGSKPTENNGAVYLLSTPASPVSYLNHRASLLGDFSAVSSYKNYAATPSKTIQGRYIMQADVGSSSFYINRQSYDLSRGGGEFLVSLSQLNGSWQMTGEHPYSSGSGQFRLRKEGASVFTEYWDGTQWITQHSRSAFLSDPARISLYTYSQFNLPTIKADLDRFSVNKGTYSDTGKMNLEFDSGVAGNEWNKLLFSSAQPAGTSIKFRTRTEETEAGLATALWSDYLTASGSPITSPPARWIEIESTLATSDTNVTPLLNDLSVTYEANAGEILWQTDVPATLTKDVVNELNHTIGTLSITGKFYLEGTLTSSTGQVVATAEYPFYVEQGNFQMRLAPDKKIYRPGETVTITGEIANLSSIAATGLTAQIKKAAVDALYSETFDLPADSSHPFTITTTAENNGVYQLNGSVTQNLALLADISEQYEVATPAVTASLAAPDTVGNEPFTISLSLANCGKVDATTSVHLLDDSGSVVSVQVITLAAGESRILNYTRQITGTTTYTAAISGDLTQTLTKKVAYAVVATDSSVSGKIITDKISYNPNEQVTLTATVSATSLRENLSTLITVTNSQGQAVHSATAIIPFLVQGQAVSSKNYWNSATYPAGTYLVTLQILDPAGSVVTKTTCNMAINSNATPTAFLKGAITLDKQTIMTGEVVTVSYSVTNRGNVDLDNIPLSIQTVNMSEQTVYNTITEQATLAMGASSTYSGLIDTHSYSAKDYLVVFRATINGVEETLAGSYFRVKGAPSAPALSSPANGSDVETFTPVLTVSNAADPNDDKLSYEFEIYSDSGLANLVTSGIIPETTGATAWIAPLPLTENLTYVWRTRAFDGRLYGPWMTPAIFRVNTANDPPTAPTISTPSEGTTVASLTPALTVTNAITYNFDLAFDPDFSQIVASTKGVAGGQGATSWTVPVNLQENGWYYWRAQADDWLMEGAWSSTARFLVNSANDAPTAPVVTSPVSGATVTALATDVIVTNSNDPDSTSLLYYFEADTAPTFDSPGIIRSGAVTEGSGTTLWNLNGLADNTGYFLRVKSSDGSADSPWSEVTGFFANTVNDPPTAPSLANPSDGAGVSLFTPKLSVHNSTDLDRDILTYEFELYADAALTNLIVQSGPVAEAIQVTGWTVPVTLTENQIYYWRARANDGSLYSGWMPTASFMMNTANDAPGVPQLSAPADGSTHSTLTPTLEIVNALDPDSSALTYDFELYGNGLPVASVSTVPENVSGKTSATLGSALADNTSYSWRARAFDGDRYGQWMDMATFTTHVPVTGISAGIRFEPETLNKKSEGNWVKVEIALPTGYRVAAADILTIRLEGAIPAEAAPVSINHGGNADTITVKFLRSAVIAALPAGDQVPVHVTGKVGAVMFEGVDIIRVIK